MKERPILFNGGMVRAILDGRKTQTRRAVKPQPSGVWAVPPLECINGRFASHGCVSDLKCPYGQPGDQLWVRENIVRFGPDSNYSSYAADDAPTCADAWPWKRDNLNSIHCPRGLSRIDLLVKNVRVERVQDITPRDAQAEGDKERSGFPEYHRRGALCHVDWFRDLWDSINEKRGFGWDKNPWVWVVDFEVTP